MLNSCKCMSISRLFHSPGDCVKRAICVLMKPFIATHGNQLSLLTFMACLCLGDNVVAKAYY